MGEGMNRRNFLSVMSRTVLAVAASGSGVFDALVSTTPITLGLDRIFFRGIPLVFDESFPSDRFYFVNPAFLHELYQDGKGSQQT